MKTNYTYTTPSNFLSYMITHPNKWYDYVTKCGFSGKSSFDQELPWLSLPAIEFIESNIGRSAKVFEFGGGGSTVFFGQRSSSVTCWESDEVWLRMIESAVAKKGLDNVTLIHKEFEIRPEKLFRQSQYITTLPQSKFDVILIDGPEIQNYKARPICFEWAEKNIKPGGMIVVDDAWRYEALLTNNKALEVKELVGIGPGRMGITKTDIYLY
ncbi:MAG: class I SAM-dependent methyltransferase [Bacteroidota bacterium]|nr:class I SAM-dependent methyltransferase [Bacteroidota bacterium]